MPTPSQAPAKADNDRALPQGYRNRADVISRTKRRGWGLKVREYAPAQWQFLGGHATHKQSFRSRKRILVILTTCIEATTASGAGTRGMQDDKKTKSFTQTPLLTSDSQVWLVSVQVYRRSPRGVWALRLARVASLNLWVGMPGKLRWLTRSAVDDGQVAFYHSLI